jgi:hypothetical protein
MPHMKALLFACSVLFSLSACSSVTPVGTAKYPPVEATRVEVLYQEPKRPYEVIAMLSHEAASRFSSVQDVVENCRELAARAGADAVIITSTYDQSVSTAAKASARAIRWKR